MRIQPKLNLSLILVILSVAILACGVFPQSSKPEIPPSGPESEMDSSSDNESEDSLDLPADAPTEPPADTDDTGSGSDGMAEPLPPLDLTNLEEFDTPVGVSSYRLSYELSLNADGEVDTQILGEGVVSLAEPGLAVTRTSKQAGGTTTYSERQLIDGFSVTLAEGRCSIVNINLLSSERNEDRISTHFSANLPRNYLTGDAKFAESGITVDGRPSVRYTLDKTNFDLDPDPAMIFSDLELGEGVVDQETGAVLSVVVKGIGQLSMGFLGWSPIGEIQYELNYTEFDQPVKIAHSPDCDPGTISTQIPFPVIEPYFLVSASDIYFEITAYLPLQEAVTFYKSALPASGWTLTDETSYGEEHATLEFKNGSGERLSVQLDQVPGTADSERGPMIMINFAIYDF